MSQTNSPIDRSIGLSGLLRWLVAVAAVITIGAALAARSYPLALAGILFLVAAASLGYRAWRARQAAGASVAPPRP